MARALGTAQIVLVKAPGLMIKELVCAMSRWRMWRRSIPVIALLALAFVPRIAAAHPHAWIDLHSTVIFNDDGKIGAIEEEWLFDEQYTEFNVQVLPPDQRASKTALTELIGKDLARIKPLGYFTEMRAGGKPVALGTVSIFDSEMRGKRLWLRFVLPLAHAIDPRAQPFTYWIGDPTYWIEMLHEGAEPIGLRGQASSGCHGRIAPPHPGPEMIAKAAALDVDGQVDPTLGRLFAEQITIECPAKGR
jgi:ABC-type uncharacterized transport system substrate-binding protein